MKALNARAETTDPAPEPARAPALDNVEDIYPLTPLQEGMVFHAAAEPGTALHVGRIVCRLSGTLDLPSFQKAWDGLLARHPALRTAFIWEGLDAPMQVVRKELAMPFQHHDWTGLPADEAEATFDDWLWRDAMIGFDLTAAPLCRVDVFSLTREDHRLVWACHHGVADGWSVGVALDDLLTLASGADHTLLPKAPSYRNHIAWLLKRDAADDEPFWRACLEGFTEPTSIDPSPGAHGAEPAGRRHYVSRGIDVRTLGPIKAAATSARVTLNTLFQAAWALVLSRHAGADDVVFGVVSSGRPDGVPGVERMVGLLVTTTPMRVQLRDRDTVRSFLKHLQADAATIRQHEQTPLTKIQSWSDLSPGEALFDSLYVFGNYPPTAERPGAALGISSVDIRAPSTFPLAILVDPDGEGGLIVTAVTDPSRYSDDIARRLVDGVVGAAQALAHDLDAPITAIDALPEAQRRALEAWGDGGALSVAFGDVVKAIEEIVERQPGAMAVAGGGKDLTYGALLDLARSAAHDLMSLGIEPGEPVIVHADREPKAIAGILAVLLAGGAYVPVDPAYPRTRNMQVVQDAGARFMVTAGDGIPDLGDLRTVNLDRAASPPPAGWSRRQVSAETPAYIIYTSGSSGRPKGVVVSRSSLAYSTAARRAFYGEPPTAFLLLSSLAFDSSVAGLFWTLTTGGLLVMAEHRLEQDVAAVAARMAHHGVTHLLCLPSLYAVLMDHADPKQLASLTHGIVAGEACPPALPARHRETLPSARLINEYGPTEATVWCMAADITETPAGQTPSIGRPIPGTAVRLVDHRDRLTPEDAVGELLIGGPGVALGYHGRPEMTTMNFPTLCGDGGGRFYRTGDFARWRADGTLDYLGRRDGQLKIRGHRIEMSEIETALEALPSVPAAAVAAIDGDAGRPRLAAFIEGDAVDVDAVRLELERRLPDAMVPRTIRALASLPRLPNGKIDRTALLTLAAADGGPRKAREDRAPSGPIETALVEIWQKVLKVGRVGVQDDFFALGGDSLASIRIVSLAKRHGLSIKPTSVLEYPTIEALARSMAPPEMRSRAGDQTSASPFFMVHGGERMHDHLERALGDRYAVHLFEDHWDDGCLAPTTSVMGMADVYLAQLRALSPKGPYLLGGYSIGAAVAVEMARRLMAAGDEVSLLFLLDPLDQVAFLGGVQGLDEQALEAVTTPRASDTGSTDGGGSKRRGLTDGLAALSDMVYGKYTRYLRGPSRLLRGALAYYAGRPVSPTIAGHYAWIVYNRAIRRHELAPYTGRLLIFRSMLGRDLSERYVWAELAKGAYDEECFDCEHIALRRDPEIVKAWTERLAAHLDRMHRPHRADSPNRSGQGQRTTSAAPPTPTDRS